MVGAEVACGTWVPHVFDLYGNPKGWRQGRG